ncbi:Short-chain dehydrogenase/reductase SDR [Dillenia turbinata]|uniref:Short-chain dehydrogenase/reductase SDR n=1 Tax=Dillenia turbinata TaxID=194707 RepID=A0AAN8ZRV4_9MAGN
MPMVVLQEEGRIIRACYKNRDERDDVNDDSDEEGRVINNCSSTAEEVTQGIDGSDLTAIVTGASSGLGTETARVLASRGVHVVMAVRNVEAGQKTKQTILEQIPNAKIDVMELDLSSMASIRKFASEYNSSGLPLNILINNAGIMASPFMLSKDKIEMQFATNHMGHFLLTNLLLDKMKKTAVESRREGRIVNLSSVAHKFTYSEGIRFDKINDESSYSSVLAYGQSKLANILHAKELSRLLAVLLKYVAHSVEQGAATTCYVAMHPQVKGISGEYFAACNVAKPSSWATDSELATKLWNFSMDLSTNGKGPSGFSSSSTAEEVTHGIDASSFTAIVTGASSGLGTETARVLALRGVHVVMAVRNVEAGQKTKQTILEQIPNAKMDVMELDLSSMASIHKFASEYNSSGLPLNILINNAGIMACPFMLSEDKIEMQFATNHMGHFLLTNLLLDKMKRTAVESQREGRIVNLSSLAHKFTYSEGIRFDKINDEPSYSRMLAYGQSKLANILHANELSRRLKEEGVNITANSVHPGGIATNIIRYSALAVLLKYVSKYVAHTVEQGTATTCYVAMHPQVKGISGEYFAACNVAQPSSWATDSELATKLWNFSKDLKGPSGFSSSSTAEEVTHGIDASGLTAIVTGASSGIGTETARVLALRDAHVVMAVRNVDAGQKVKESILKEIPTAKVDVMELDLSSVASVRKFASEYISFYLLLGSNNAGVMACPFMLSQDKIELQFATNHIVMSHYLRFGHRVLQLLSKRVIEWLVFAAFSVILLTRTLLMDLKLVLIQKIQKKYYTSLYITKLPFVKVVYSILFLPFPPLSMGLSIMPGTSHFLLTNLLLDTMKKTALESKKEGRIVNLSSMGHQFTYREGIRFDKINDESSYNTLFAYGQSKLSNILHAKELTRRLKEEGVEITANALHPGAIATNLMRYHRFVDVMANTVGKLVLKSIPQGAATTCYVALSPQVKGVSGEYFSDSNIAKPSSMANDAELAKKLWDFSMELTS